MQSPLVKSNLSRKTAIAWVTLACGLLASVFAALQVKQGLEQDAARQFAFDGDQVVLKVREHLDAYALMLRGGAGLFAASTTVERDEWRAYVGTLQASGAVPEVQGIGFAQVIPPDQLAAHVERIRGEGFPDYSVHPPGERALYTSVIYLEPFSDRNLRAFGFDMYTEPVRRAAMDQARDTGEAALSGKVELVQETGVQAQAGTLMYVPVYRNGAPVGTLGQRRAALIGWVFSAYRMNDLMTGILGDWGDHAGKAVDLRIYDGREASPAGLLFDSQPAFPQHGHSLLHLQRTLDFNGRPWLLVFERPTSVATLSAIGYAPWSTLAGGLALSALLFWLMRSLINTRATAIGIAQELIAEITQSRELLRKSHERTRFLLDSTAEGIYGIDLDGNCTFCNSACLQLLGYAHPDDLLGKNMYRQIHAGPGDGTPSPVEASPIFQAFNTAERGHVDDELLRRADGTTFPAEYWWSPQSRDAVVVGAVVSFLDITGRKRLEEIISRSRLLLLTVIDTAPLRVFWKDRDSRYLGCNMAFAKDAGMTHPKDLIGKDDRDLAWAAQAQMYRADDQSIMESGIPKLAYEEEQTTVTGRTIWLRSSKVPLRNEQGEVFGLVGFYQDITDDKLLEEARDEALDLLIKVASRVPGVIYQYRQHSDGSSCFPYASDAIREIYRVSPGDVREDGSQIFSILHPDDRDATIASIRQSAQDLTPWRHEYRVKFADGTVRWLSGNAMPQREASGATLWHGFISDITEHQQTEQALRISEERLRVITSSAPDAIIMLDEAGDITFWNEAAERMFGYARDEVLGHNLHALLVPQPHREAYLRVFPHFQRTGQGAAVGKTIERTGLRKDGSEFPLALSLSAAQMTGAWNSIGIVRDITEMKRMQDALARRESEMRTTLYGIGEAVISLDGKGCVLLMNPVAEELTGWHESQARGKPLDEVFCVVDEATRSRVDSPAALVFNQAGIVALATHALLIARDGTERAIGGSAAPILDQGRDIAGIVLVFRDLTEEREAAGIIRDQLAIIETYDGLVALADLDGKLIYINAGGTRMLGAAAPDEILTSNITDFITRTTSQRGTEESLPTAMADGAFNGESTLKRLDGTGLPVAQTLFSIPDADGNPRHIGAIIMDISLQKEMQAKLMMSEKLAVMGRLLADVSHELNNPLAIVIGRTELILNHLDEQSPVKAKLETVLQSARRCKTILGNLLAYSGTIGKKAGGVDLPALIREALEAVTYQYDMSAIAVTVNCNLPADIEIPGTKDALLSVFINLVRNARQAMPRQGSLTVTVAPEDAGLLRITVRDSGLGMSKERLQTMFQPFNSGWKDGGGTGIGLATSRGIIETHGGRMWVESEGEGHGTQFTMLLPYRKRRG